MSDLSWSIIVIALVIVIYLILVKDWRLEPEGKSHVYRRPPSDSAPPTHRADSADYKRGV